MATPGKAQDPAAAALTAIEEALNLSAARTDSAARESENATQPQIELRLPTPRDSETDDEETHARHFEAETRPALPPSTRPANDDRPSVGQILQALQMRPSRGATIAGALAAAVWAGLWFAYVATTSDNLLAAGWLSPAVGLTLLALVGPIAFFLVIGMIVRRTQEMRLTARSMTEVAIRLAEPETIATEQVMTLSQAIRREVSSMGDGIERALARASELEALVRTEVSKS